MVVKTREKLLEVARQLFANNGIENTTMNDIANASEKGRRTIYTYFKNKKEIYNAVIERESELSVHKLREIVKQNISPTEKLRLFFDARFNIVKDSTLFQEDPLKRFFIRDIKKIERIRKLAFEKEKEIINEIITEGIEMGLFDKKQCDRFEPLRLLILQGVDLAYLRDNFFELGIDKNTFSTDLIEFIINGIKI